MTDFIEEYEVLVPSELCDDCIASYEKLTNQEPHLLSFGHIQKGEGKLFREDYSFQFEEFGNIHLASSIFNILNEASEMYREKYSILNKLEYNTMRLKIQKTPIGGGYHGWHCESMDAVVSNRLIVWTVYLNDVEEGGETEFLYQNKRIRSNKGSVLLFPASYTHTHRGNPPISNEKYILTGWYHIQDPR